MPMKRREVLKALMAAPLAGALCGCTKYIRRHPLRPGVLRVILQGPFAVIVHQNAGNRITAYVPVDPDNLHKFRFQSLSTDLTDPHYQFELKTNGLTKSPQAPYIDRCFDDATVRISNWKADPPSEYFVSINLPAPQIVTFIPPAETVTFKHGTRRIGHMPANHVLEYRIDDLDDLHMNSNSPELDRQTPTPCSDLVERYRDHRAREEESHKRMLPGEPMSLPMQPPDLCSDNDAHTYFFGVGVDPETPRLDKAAHGVRFFNQQLLPSLHDSRATRDMELESIGDYRNPASDRDNTSLTSGLTEAVWRGPAHSISSLVSYVEDCKSTGLIAVTP